MEDPYQVTITKTDTKEVVKTGIYDVSVSRIHAKIFIDKDKIYIVDTGTRNRGSTNGTFVNDRRIPPLKPIELKIGDRIKLGLMTVMRVGGIKDGKPVIKASEGELLVLTKEEARSLPTHLLKDSIVLDENRVGVVLKVLDKIINTSKYKVLVEEAGGKGYINEILRRLLEARRELLRPNPDLNKAALKLLPLVKCRRYKGILQEIAEDEFERLESIVMNIRMGKYELGPKPLLDAIDAFFELVEASR
ncbi:MAG: FHA domain-containing protein [Desulfurococcales archaeon]|nr:FHA domain-containing protein [Desulfurococcales archaeon]